MTTTDHRSRFRHLERLRVRWAEVDMQQIVFNGHYLTYFDTAVGGYWRALALPYQATMHTLGGDLFVRKATLEYESSARYDDTLDIGVRCARIGNSSMVFECAVLRGDERLVGGELVYVFADAEARGARPVPQDLRAVLEDFEAGKPMVEVRVAGWAELGEAARPIRTQVFVEEQRIPAALEWDEADATCTHAVAFNRFGVPLATGRLLEHVPGVAKIGRMAVLPAMRGTGVGRQVLQSLMDTARARGDREVLLHAQLSAERFYRQQGFQQRGPVFDEAGIPHVEMVRGL
ncbi:YbgC/FadM family acyl-CoA thioesterase [Aquabacterium sp. J223]|uniref:YbgC/FadM family acyl-CoA thioesterase n=1 Tax=Aquabacterium sp. J223 TaxID=2898431 RepID=UPI0021AD621B|nr:YbgC/FadM family acyl-CoA thioesterase [Aquabacterium sp. J223]UUX94297.1 YbgC/FadM family acyl-CoA thioesterase [Aquabacterium sp. J223]